jgi:hypothetical protein
MSWLESQHKTTETFSCLVNRAWEGPKDAIVFHFGITQGHLAFSRHGLTGVRICKDKQYTKNVCADKVKFIGKTTF